MKTTETSKFMDENVYRSA